MSFLLRFSQKRFQPFSFVGDISEEAKHAYNLLIEGRTTSSPEKNSHCTSNGDLSSNHQELEQNDKAPPPPAPPQPPIVLFGSSSSSSSTSISTNSISTNTRSNTSSSSSSNPQKSDRHSHYSSTSTDNDISTDLQPHSELSPLKYVNPSSFSYEQIFLLIRLLRNGLHPSQLIAKPPLRPQISIHESSPSNHSPLSSTSNTLSNLSSNSPLFDHPVSLPPPSSHSSSSSSNNDDNRSMSSLNSRSLSSNKIEGHSITGQPLPPPPDLSSLGSKLTTATMTHTLKLPAPSTANAYRSKSTNIRNS